MSTIMTLLSPPVGGFGIFIDRDQQSIFIGSEFQRSCIFLVLVTAAAFFRLLTLFRLGYFVIIYRLPPPFLLYLFSNYHKTWCVSSLRQNLSKAVNTTRSISVRIEQFLSERSRTQLVHVIPTLVLSERRQILSHRIFNEGYQCHNDSVPIVLTLF